LLLTASLAINPQVSASLSTTGLDLPERRMISAAPQPSAVAMIHDDVRALYVHLWRAAIGGNRFKSTAIRR
jgi:hypothetical protein